MRQLTYARQNEPARGELPRVSEYVVRTRSEVSPNSEAKALPFHHTPPRGDTSAFLVPRFNPNTLLQRPRAEAPGLLHFAAGVSSDREPALPQP